MADETPQTTTVYCHYELPLFETPGPDDVARRTKTRAVRVADYATTFGQLKREDDERMRKMGLTGGLFDQNDKQDSGV